LPFPGVTIKAVSDHPFGTLEVSLFRKQTGQPEVRLFQGWVRANETRIDLDRVQTLPFLGEGRRLLEKRMNLQLVHARKNPISIVTRDRPQPRPGR